MALSNTHSIIEPIKNLLGMFGLTLVQQQVYEQLLLNRQATIEAIKDATGLSYAQVQHNLNVMIDKNLVAASPGTKPKRFIAINPKNTLADILDTRYKDLQESLKRFETELRIHEQASGQCTRQVTFYHYSDMDLAMENIHALLSSASTEIVISSPPPSLLRRVESTLHDSYLKGVSISLYYSILDFDEIDNYIELILDILKRTRVTIIQTREKTCQLVRFNDIIMNMGNFLVDGVQLCSYVFRDDVIHHVNGFFNPPIVDSAKKFLEIKTIENKIEENPEPIQAVLDAIKHQGLAKTRDIGNATGVSGAMLRKFLDYLIQQNLVTETIVKSEGAGRPKRIYQLVE